MNTRVIVSNLVFLTVGCKAKLDFKTAVQLPQVPRPSTMVAPTPVQAAPTQDAVAWNPISKGATYQLSLKKDAFTFCDNTGPQTVDLTTGRQTAGAFPCDRKHDAVRNGCDDGVDVVGSPDEPFDVVSAEGYGFRLHGHVRDCDRDGNLLVVSTTGEIVMMDASVNKMVFVKADVPDTVVLSSGWVAWNSLDKQLPLHLEKASALLQKAVTPHYD